MFTAFIVSMIIGAVSCDIHDLITASYFYLVWPIVIFIFSLIVYLFAWLLNRRESLIVAIIFSILNIVINTILLIYVIR